MVTSVDEEQRHEDLPGLQDEFDNDIANLEKRRNAEIEERAKKVEAIWLNLRPKAKPRAPHAPSCATAPSVKWPPSAFVSTSRSSV